MRIIFMGTPDFAVPSLEALIGSEHQVVAVIAQPDKPKGRGRKLASPPTKIVAEEYGIPVLQPPKIRTRKFVEELGKLSPDLICVAAYGKILPKDILELPRYGCINVHASLLPEYRGAAPVNWAIVRGEEVTGVTTMLMDEGMDTGDILLRAEIPIDEQDTGESLTLKLASAGAELLIETIAKLGERSLIPQSQDDSRATYAPMLKKKDGRIDWSLSPENVRNLVRGMLPWPGAFTYLGDKVLKIYRVSIAEGRGDPGKVIEAEPEVLRVCAGDGAVDVLELQIEGGKRMDTAAFLAGRKIEPGTVLGG